MKFNTMVGRHGQSIENVVNRLIREGQLDEIPDNFYSLTNAEYPLSPLGEKQADELADYISVQIGNQTTLVVSSTFTRAIQTAERIVSRLKRAPVIRYDPRLVERDFGQVNMFRNDPVLAKELDEEFNRSFNDPEFSPFRTGETFFQVIDRVQVAIAEWADYAQLLRVENLLFVNHGEVVRANRVIRLGLPPDIQLRKQPANISNAQLDHYSMRHPESGKLSSAMYFKSVCLHTPENGCDWRTY